MKKGWLCPRCGTVNAPFIGQCTCKQDVTKDRSNISDLTNMCACQQGEHKWKLLGIYTGGTTYICEICGKTKTYPVEGIKNGEITM